MAPGDKWKKLPPGWSGVGWMREPANRIMDLTQEEERRTGTLHGLSPEEYMMNHMGMLDMKSPAKRRNQSPDGRKMTGTITGFGRSASSPSLRTSEPAGASFLMMAELIDQDFPADGRLGASVSLPSSPSCRLGKASRLQLDIAGRPASVSGSRSAAAPPLAPPKRPSAPGELTTIDFSDILQRFGEGPQSPMLVHRAAASPADKSKRRAAPKKHPDVMRLSAGKPPLFSQNLSFQVSAKMLQSPGLAF